MTQGADPDPRLRAFAELLRASPHNLLSPRGLAELETRHFPEALRFAASLPAGRRLLDVGSGGGLPGVVIAIARPDLAVELLDATGKKAAFLREVGQALDLQLAVHHGRAEELAHTDLAGAFDLVTARAVAPLERLVPWCAPFMTAGGTLHAIKGERWAEELAEADRAIVEAGLEVVATPDLRGGDEEQCDGPAVVVLRRPS